MTCDECRAIAEGTAHGWAGALLDFEDDLDRPPSEAT
jgi:hypothetical protein